MDDIISDDSLFMIFKMMDIRGIVSVKRVSRRWSAVADNVLLVQKSLGFGFFDKCGDRRHRIGWNEVIKSRYLFNSDMDTTIFSTILHKCPNLKCIYVPGGTRLIYRYFNHPLQKMDSSARPDMHKDGSFGLNIYTWLGKDNQTDRFKDERFSNQLLDIIMSKLNGLECIVLGNLFEEHIDVICCRLVTKYHKTLTHLSLGSVSNESVEFVGKYAHNLRRLDISAGYSHNFDGKLLSFGRSFQSLAINVLKYNSIDNLLLTNPEAINELTLQCRSCDLKLLSSCLVNLESLTINVTDCRASDLLWLMSLSKLRVLKIQNMLHDTHQDALLDILMRMKRLKKLHVWVYPDSLKMMKCLPVKAPQLESLKINDQGSNATLIGLESLMKLKKLGHLKLVGLNLTEDEFVTFISYCSHIKTLKVSQPDTSLYTKPVMEALTQLAKSKCENLSILLQGAKKLKNFPDMKGHVIPDNLFLCLKCNDEIYVVDCSGPKVLQLYYYSNS